MERRRNIPASSTPVEATSTEVETDYIPHRRGVSTRKLFKGLSWLDRLLSVLILLSMVLGVIIGAYPSQAR